MKKLPIWETFEAGFEHFTRRGWYLAGLTAAVLPLSLFVVGDAVTTALYSILFVGYISLLLKHARQETITFDDLFVTDNRWIYYAFGSVIKALLVILGLLLFVVPGIYLSIRWMFSDMYILDKGMRPVEALKASSELTKHYWWPLFWFSMLTLVIILFGVLALGVGLFVAVPVTGLSYILLFWKLQEIQYLNSQG